MSRPMSAHAATLTCDSVGKGPKHSSAGVGAMLPWQQGASGALCMRHTMEQQRRTCSAVTALSSSPMRARADASSRCASRSPAPEPLAPSSSALVPPSDLTTSECEIGPQHTRACERVGARRTWVRAKSNRACAGACARADVWTRRSGRGKRTPALSHDARTRTSTLHLRACISSL